MKKGDKKAQFFLLTALILIFIIYTLVIEYNTLREHVALEDFEDLSENYQLEQTKVINKAIYDDEDESGEIEKFTSKFLGYANQQDPNFGVLNVYVDTDGNIHIINLLNDKEIKISYVGDEFGVEETGLKLYSGDTGTTGQICSGAGCVTAHSQVGDFGEGFYTEHFKDATMLKIQIGEEGEDGEFYVDLNEFKSSTYIRSEEDTEELLSEEGGLNIVKADLIQHN